MSALELLELWTGTQPEQSYYFICIHAEGAEEIESPG